ncbi:MAG: hypothetical protein IJ410_07580 [Oscillospiraceae bacterium]|nr:hypothetical protein [Oscillospiraceae bacterium]
MKKLISYILTAAMVLSMTGCSSAGSITTFTAAVEEMPTNFDPQIATAPRDLLVISNIFDGLFETVNGETRNNLAESCTISSDGKTYTITLKQDSIFHCRGNKKDEFNGTGVTAHDFVFAINRVLDPKTHSPYIDDFSNILAVTAENNYTLVIKLKKPDYNFCEKLASTAAFPCNEEFFWRAGGAYGLSLDNILSNGPFMLNYLDTEGGNATILRMDENEKGIARIRLKKLDSASQATGYTNEEISGYFAYSARDTAYSDTASIEFDSGNISLVFNMDNTAFANENVRKALGWYAFAFRNSGANLQAVDPCTRIFPGTVTLAGKYITDLIAVTEPAYMGNDPKSMIQQGLAELDMSKLPAATILMPDDSMYTLIYENINQLWQKNLGQFFTIEYLPTSQLKQRVAQGDFDMAFLPLTPDNSTPYGLLDMFTGYYSWLDDTINSAKGKADQNNAIADITAAQDIILQSAMAVPMGSEQTVFYYRNYFADIYADPFTGVINLKHATVK